MRRYIGYNSLDTPKFQRRDHGKPSAMAAHLNREGQYADSSAYTFRSQRATDKNLFRNAYEKTQLSRCTDDISFYTDEYNWMLEQIIQDTPDYGTEDDLMKLLNISELANEALYAQDHDNDILLGGSSSKALGTLSIGDLLHWKQLQDKKHERFMLNEYARQDRDEEVLSLRNWFKNTPSRFSYMTCSMPKDKLRLKSNWRTCKSVVKPADQRKKCREKKPTCWHFLQGHCKRGKYCDFSHDKKHGWPDSFKVFLGGLPFHVTTASLKQQLLDQGFHVVNKPKVHGRFSPQVCLASAAEAQRLIKKGSIKISGMTVDVRNYQAFTKKSQYKLDDINSRSVSLGGLRKGTTYRMIKKELLVLGLKIVNQPWIKDGFSPRVTLATQEQARKLIKMVKVHINGAFVHIWPKKRVGAQA